MKYIKKVSASQLISNQGTIIDSMNPGDDQTVNAPSIHAVKNYIEDNVENYSTTEQRIGTWIDRKTFIYESSNNYCKSFVIFGR